MIRLENGLTALLISDESYSLEKLDQEEKDLIEKELTADSGGEGESIDELIDSVTDIKKAIVIQYLTPLPNYREQIVKLPNP